MDADLRKVLEEAADYVAVECTFNYSGRGMYGATCFGITGQLNGLIAFLRVLDDDTADALSDPRVDNMGLDYIYYWPELKTGEGYL